MIRNYKTVKLSEEDKKGFKFCEYDRKDQIQRVKAAKKCYHKQRLFCAILLIIICILRCFIKMDDISIAVDIMIFAMLCYLLMLNYISRSSKKDVLRYRKYIEVNVQNILDIEKEYEHNSECGTIKYEFYPIVGRDIYTNYESRCYISLDEYKSIKLNDVIRIDVKENV